MRFNANFASPMLNHALSVQAQASPDIHVFYSSKHIGSEKVQQTSQAKPNRLYRLSPATKQYS